jgi:hypothetical protein
MNVVPREAYPRHAGYVHECNELEVHIMCTRPKGEQSD